MTHENTQNRQTSSDPVLDLTDQKALAATRLATAAWSQMKDSPYSNFSYGELPPRAKARVDRTVAVILRELADELLESLLSRVEPGMVVRPNVIPKLLRDWSAVIEKGEQATHAFGVRLPQVVDETDETGREEDDLIDAAHHHSPPAPIPTTDIATITPLSDGYLQVDHPTGHRYRLRLPAPDDIDLECQDTDNCQFEITAYHHHNL